MSADEQRRDLRPLAFPPMRAKVVSKHLSVVVLLVSRTVEQRYPAAFLQLIKLCQYFRVGIKLGAVPRFEFFPPIAVLVEPLTQRRARRDILVP